VKSVKQLTISGKFTSSRKYVGRKILMHDLWIVFRISPYFWKKDKDGQESSWLLLLLSFLSFPLIVSLCDVPQGPSGFLFFPSFLSSLNKWSCSMSLSMREIINKPPKINCCTNIIHKGDGQTQKQQKKMFDGYSGR